MGDQLAYTDYDERGIIQVYLTDFNNNSRQVLTTFKDKNHKPGPIQWSPTGMEIAILLGENQDSFREAWIISVITRQAYSIKIPSEITKLGSLILWSADGNKILLYGSHDTNDTGLYWFDVRNNQLLHTLTVERANLLNEKAVAVTLPFSLSPDLSIIGFYNSYGEFFTYKLFSQNVEIIEGLNAKGWETIWDIKAFPVDLFSCKK